MNVLSMAADIQRGYQEVIELYPRTNIAAYCVSRLSGLHQLLGESDKAAEIMEKAIIDCVGGEDANKLKFNLGLIHSQARNDPKQAITWFSQIPKPTRESDRDAAKIYLSAQQQIVKCQLCLDLITEAKKRATDFKAAIPKLADDMNHFHQFEVQQRNQQHSGTPAKKQPTIMVLRQTKCAA